MGTDQGTAGQPSLPHSVPLMQMRHTMAVNLFKSYLLDEIHKPGNPQSDLVWSHFIAAGQDDALDLRTWKRWFQPGVWSTHPLKYEVLDRVLGHVARRALEDACDATPWPMTVISSLACGGLVRELLSPTKAANPFHTLTARAADYTPVSPLHLHVDAIEAAALATGNGDVPWETAKAIAAKRILEIIHQRWNRRSGSIYAHFSADPHGTSASDEAAPLRLELGSGIDPARLARGRRRPSTPTWRITNIQPSEASIHAHRLMYALAADAEFLVADRFDSWYLDLSTAAIAMFALAWSERRATFGQARVQDEQIYWRAFEYAFLRESPDVSPSKQQSREEAVFASADGFDNSAEIERTISENAEPEEPRFHPELSAALDLTGAEWHQGSVEVLLRASSAYKAQVNELGESLKSIRATVVSCTHAQPVRFRGSE